MKRKVLSVAYHRNGVMGDGFHVVLFRDEDRTTKVAVAFGAPESGTQVATLQVDLLAAGDVAFGSNSWRCETYSSFVLQAIADYWRERDAIAVKVIR